MTSALVLSGGGPLAVAWECGVVAGLAQAGLRLNPVDFILGTSAGAMVGAQLAAGEAPQSLLDAILREHQGVPPPGAMPAQAIQALAKLPELFAQSQRDEAGRRAVGSYALATASLESEADFVARIEQAIGSGTWPDQDFGVVAVDVADGQPEVLRRGSGAAMAAAVAASCCLPGLSPPVALFGRRFMDGGMRSTANVDLASGFDTVLVLSFHPPGPPGDRITAQVSRQAEALVKAGARVSIISPDAASLAAIGPPGMDPGRRPELARAGAGQGMAAVDAVATFWRSPGAIRHTRLR